MAKPYFILKMLKKKLNEKFQQSKCVINGSQNSSYSKHNKKAYKYIKCRICLNEGTIPIYGIEPAFDIPEAIRTIGGVEVTKDDEYPKHLCEECYSLLKGALLFRKSAQESDEILHQMLISENTSTHSEDDTKKNVGTAPKVTKKYKCKTCQLIFKTVEAYTIHKKSKNHKSVRIQCRICKKLLTPKLYEKHLARHRSASHLVCEVCGKLYRKDNLLRHLQLHSNNLPFQCQECPYRGRFMESLKIHMRTHSGDKPFSCNKCELRFITRSNLNRHLLTHEKEKPFRCVECNRGFYSQRDLDIHLKADHAGIKEFSCRVCGNKYGTKKALMRHELRVHKRDKMAKGRMPLYLQAEFQNRNELP